MKNDTIPTRSFPTGQVLATTGAVAACGYIRLMECFVRHIKGDWGNVCQQDAALNDAALQAGNRVLSAYPIDPAKPSKGHGENTVWIITEADRSATTFLLPDEY